MRAIDFHTHAFPDRLAEQAMHKLSTEGNIAGRTDGTIAGLLRSMDAAGVARSVVCSIATRPEQFDSILKWSREIASERIIPFPSIHPADPEAVARVRQTREAGFAGIKLHAYYQGFDMDDPRMMEICAAADAAGLIVMCHAGFDMAFERVRRADPERLARVAEAFPNLRLVGAHLGGWEDWEQTRRHLLGRPIYLDLSFTLDYFSPQAYRDLIEAHPADRLLFATDSPWKEPGEDLARIEALGLDAALLERILWRNAERLLAEAGWTAPKRANRAGGREARREGEAT
jgi:predicted TIM-barrel fold metal-dependent hydrolase